LISAQYDDLPPSKNILPSFKLLLSSICITFLIIIFQIDFTFDRLSLSAWVLLPQWSCSPAKHIPLSATETSQ